MTLKESQRYFLENFLYCGFSSPLLDIQLLHAHVLGINYEKLILHEEKLLTTSECKNIQTLCKRRLKHEPLSYILGTKEFYSLDFLVGDGVLIPRPETEELVGFILENYKNINVHRILDLCCGSGCIGVALGVHIDYEELFFVDKSEVALNFTKKNMERHISSICKSKIKIICSDLCRSLLDNNLESSFDVIVSNPPYLTSDEIHFLDKDVQDYEPLLALQIPNNDIFCFFKQLFTEVYFLLHKRGRFFLETSPNLITQQMQLLKEIGFKSIDIQKDLSQKDRFIFCSK